MSTKKIILVVDNRTDINHLEHSNLTDHKNILKESGYNVTEVDGNGDMQKNCTFNKECISLVGLEERINKIQQRIKFLEDNSDFVRRKKRIRRKAKQINKQFQCPFQECSKLYGSQTSLKNHIKIKHVKKCTQTQN